MKNSFNQKIFSIKFLFAATGLGYLLEIMFAWSKRLRLGIGLTDEGLVAAQTSDSFFLQKTNWGIARIYSFLHEFSGGSIHGLRIIWLVIFCSILILLGWTLLQRVDNFPRNRFVILTCILTGLTIPSMFRFLLLTPTYQGLLFVSCISIVSVILLSSRTTNTNFHVVQGLVIGLSFCIATISRPSSSLILIITSAIYFYNSGKKPGKVFLIISGIGMFLWPIVLFKNPINVLDSLINQYYFAKSIGSEAFSMTVILFHYSYTLGITISLLLLSQLILRKSLLKEKVKTRYFAIFRFVIFFLWVLSLKLFSNLLYVDSKTKIGILFVMFLLGSSLKSFQNSRILLANLTLAFLPATSTLGSSIPLSYNWPLLIFSASLFLALNQQESHSLTRNKPWTIGTAMVLVLLSLISINYSNHDSNYEKISLDQGAQSKYRDLQYSHSKALALERWTSETDLNSKMGGEPILDLSYFHPGLVYFTDSPMYPYFLADEVFSASTNSQMSFLSKIFAIDGETPKRFLVSSDKEFDNSASAESCKRLGEWPANQLLKEALVATNLNPNVRLVSFYNRQVEDLTMRSPFIYLLEKCV